MPNIGDSNQFTIKKMSILAKDKTGKNQRKSEPLDKRQLAESKKKREMSNFLEQVNDFKEQLQEKSLIKELNKPNVQDYQLKTDI